MFGAFFLSVFSLFLILILDLLSAVFSILSIIFSIFRRGSGDDLLGKIFSSIGFTAMDIRGIRKLRSISQLIFESFP